MNWYWYLIIAAYLVIAIIWLIMEVKTGREYLKEWSPAVYDITEPEELVNIHTLLPSILWPFALILRLLKLLANIVVK